jgi:lipid-binding SYLF domain-containing protein
LKSLVLASVVVTVASANDPATKKAKHDTDHDTDFKAAEKLQDAEEVLTAALTAPDKGIPKDLLGKAECVGVFPELKKGAIVIGAEFGRGVFTCRDSAGRMGAPAFFTMGGGSVGWQFGGQETDVVLLIMNKNGVEHLLEDKFAIGGEASAVAGPVGRTAQAATDAQLHAQILSWSRARGAFVGASLEGTVIKPDKDANAAFYGKPVSARDLLVTNTMSVPGAAKSFVDKTNGYAMRASK